MYKAPKFFDDKIVIPIHPNDKKALIPYGNLKKPDDVDINQYYNSKTKYNFAVLTGERSNITVVDIDVKDDGLKTWNELIDKHGDIDTIKVRSRNGGLHYYFKYNENIKQTQGLNGVGVDIRANGGYIVMPPSQIDGKYYKWINHPDETELLDIPDWLFEWITINYNSAKINKNIETFKRTITTKFQKNKNSKVLSPLFFANESNIVSEITPKEIIELLNGLPKEYNNEYGKWLIITTILTNIQFVNMTFEESCDTKFNIWNDWSKQSSKYDYNKNVCNWNGIETFIHVNWLINEYNKYNDIKKYHIHSYRQLKNIDYSKITCEQLIINQRYLTENLYIGRKTIFVKSATGTGKTTSVCQFLKRYINTDTKIISLVSRISLATQQHEVFNNFGISTKLYDDKKLNVLNDNVICQIDSLFNKFENKNIDFTNYVVYMDEVASLINHLLTSETINKNRKELQIYLKLVKIISQCELLICSDADINNLTIDFIQKFRDIKYSLFINNEYKTNSNIQAYNYNGDQKLVEDLFIKKMCEDINNNNYFVCCFDSKNICEQMYNTCKLKYPELSNKFIHHVSVDGDKIENITELWKDKYVFFSPSIIYGIDFNNVSFPQKVYAFFTDRSISPLQMGQMINRTRYISELHYYIKSDDFGKNPKYNDIDDITKYYNDFAEQYANVLSKYGAAKLVGYEMRLDNDNDFFKLYMQNELINDTFHTNSYLHLRDILINKGFIINKLYVDGDRIEANKSKKERVEFKQQQDENYVNNYIECIKSGFKDEDIEQCATPYKEINDRKNILHLDANNIDEYKEYLEDKYKFIDHLNLCKLITNKDYQLTHLNDEKINKTATINIYKEMNTKINIIYELEKQLNINTLDINYTKYINNFDEKININKDTLELIKKTFAKNKIKDEYKTFIDGLKLLTDLYTYVCGTNIILTERKQINKKRYTLPLINKDEINKQIELYKLRNNNNIDKLDINVLNLLL